MQTAEPRSSATNATLDERGSKTLGVRVKAFRTTRRLTLRQLGDMTATTASFLSLLERGRSGASASTWMLIANALGISVADLFDERSPSPRKVLKRSERPALPTSNGYRKTLLSQRPIHDVEVYVGEFDVGGSTGAAPYSHGNAHEMFLVLRGHVEVTLGDERFAYLASDDARFVTGTEIVLDGGMTERCD